MSSTSFKGPTTLESIAVTLGPPETEVDSNKVLSWEYNIMYLSVTDYPMELMHTTITTWLGMCLSHSSPTLPNWSSTKPATVLCGIGDPTVRSFTNLSRTKGSGETLMTSIWDFIPQWPGSQHSMFFHKKKCSNMFKKWCIQERCWGWCLTIILTIKKASTKVSTKKGYLGSATSSFYQDAAEDFHGIFKVDWEAELPLREVVSKYHRVEDVLCRVLRRRIGWQSANRLCENTLHPRFHLSFTCLT